MSTEPLRQIVLDTETTGREVTEGNRVIEIGCLELVNRRLTGKHYHQYINPQRASEPGALAVHGLKEDFLSTQPLFKNIAEAFLNFVKGAQLIIHNAPFDVGFLNHELRMAGKHYGKLTDHCTVLDTLPLARQLHPGQRNSLDALCKRYSVDNSHRDLHGALLDSELLCMVYLAMTGGQVSMFAEASTTSNTTSQTSVQVSRTTITDLPVILANETELAAHQTRLAALSKAAGKSCIWNKE